MTKWKYGDAWERFPIEKGEIWGIPENGSKVAVHDIFDPLPEFMLDADMLFVDPPWNRGNINSFYTKAGMADSHIADFGIFEQRLFECIRQVAPRICYLEVGFQAVDKWQHELERIYPYVQCWNTFYYRKHPNHILRGGLVPQGYDYTGMDEEKVIYQAAKIEDCSILGDLCMGRGLVGLAAWSAGKSFVGTELNKRRLANLLQRLAKKGAKVKRYDL